MSEKLLIEIEDHIAKLTINNPPANTWDQESLSFLKKTIEELNVNKEIFSLVITGKGDKFFSTIKGHKNDSYGCNNYCKQSCI